MVVLLLPVADLRSAIGFSSFAVLTYCVITNAATLRLNQEERQWPQWISLAGLLGCGLLDLSLPLISITSGVMVLLVGTAVFGWRKRRQG